MKYWIIFNRLWAPFNWSDYSNSINISVDNEIMEIIYKKMTIILYSINNINCTYKLFIIQCFQKL